MARHPAGKSTYRVEPGDSLWDIAAARVDPRDVPRCVRSIYQMNRSRITDADLIYPGDAIQIPEDC
jgi:nucleoid-associated protein YgaU